LWHLLPIESCSKRNGVAASVPRGDREQPRTEDGWGKIGIPARPESAQIGKNHGAKCRFVILLESGGLFWVQWWIEFRWLENVGLI